MPSAGFVIFAGARAAGFAGQPASPGGKLPSLVPEDGLPRLSQATIAFTRGSCWPT